MNVFEKRIRPVGGNARSKQRGVALFISLVFLLILTIVGVASMNDTLLQTKMVGAMQDSNQALQLTELALRDGEYLVEAQHSLVDFGTVTGMYSEGSTISPYDSSAWTAARSIAASTIGLDDNAAASRYFVQYTGKVDDSKQPISINVDPVGHDSGAGVIYGFRIVGRATGQGGTSVRIIESFYGKRF